MKQIIRFSFIALLCVLVLGSGCTAAAAPTASALRHAGQEIMDATDTDAWLASAGSSGTDWYLFASSKLGLAPEGTRDALRQAIQTTYDTGGYSKSTDAARVALAYAAAGGDITDVMGDASLNLARDEIYGNATLAKSGINALVYGLLALDTGAVVVPKDAALTRTDVIQAILKLQLKPSGGFTLAGTVPDPDMTAMVISALAPYYQTDTKVAAAVEGALSFLSKAQLENGGFQSFGVEGCESAAQVVIALTALGIDPTADGRFIKAKGNPYTAVCGFRVASGKYAHVSGGKASGIATAQAMCAFAAYYRLLTRQSPLFAADSTVPAVYRPVKTQEPTSSVYQTATPSKAAVSSKHANSSVQTSVSSADTSVTSDRNGTVSSQNSTVMDTTSKAAKPNASNVPKTTGAFGWRLPVAILLLVFAGALIVVFCLLVRHGKHLVKAPCAQLLGVVAVLLIAALLLLTLRIQSVDSYYNDTDTPQDEPIGSITLSVECLLLLEQPETVPNKLKNDIPADGYLLPPTEIPLYSGESVFAILCRAAKKHKLQIEYSDTSGAYIEGIGYLYEFSCGELSGWVYTVNGVKAEVASSDYFPASGDQIVWHYSLELGQDVAE